MLNLHRYHRGIHSYILDVLGTFQRAKILDCIEVKNKCSECPNRSDVLITFCILKLVCVEIIKFKMVIKFRENFVCST